MTWVRAGGACPAHVIPASLSPRKRGAGIQQVIPAKAGIQQVIPAKAGIQ
jgi:hypothetical protein